MSTRADTPSTPPTPQRTSTLPKGKLDMRHLLKWLRDDGALGHDEADQLAKRFGQAGSSLHPLLRLGGGGPGGPPP